MIDTIEKYDLMCSELAKELPGEAAYLSPHLLLFKYETSVEVRRELVKRYIDRVRANYLTPPVRMTWWDDEWWKKHCAMTENSHRRFNEQAELILANIDSVEPTGVYTHALFKSALKQIRSTN